SEVIHAGIYYPPGSLKAQLCVAGKAQLYAYAAEAGIEHRRLGKIIVATRDDEVAALEQLRRIAEQNGVLDLEWLEPAQLAKLEPQVRAVRALLSPSTGIIDSHGLLAALRREAVAGGAQIVVKSPVRGGRVLESGFELGLGGKEPSTLTCQTVINAAGLWAQ